MRGAGSIVPKLLQATSDRWPESVWMRKKQSGLWQEYTWKVGYEKVKHFSLGLMEIGFGSGEAICILGESDPHWFWAEIAAQAAGGDIVAVPPEVSAEQIKEAIHALGVTIMVVQDQEQVDKVLEISNDLPQVRKVIYWNDKAMRGYKDSLLARFEEIMDMGRRRPAGAFEEAVVRVSEDDTALICYEAGDSEPKRMTHAYLAAACNSFSSVDPILSRDEWFCTLPPESVIEQALALMGSLQSGMKLNFPENQYTIQQDIREIGPTLLVNIPTFWKSLGSNIQDRVGKSTFAKRGVYHFLFPVGERIADRKLRGEKPNPCLRAAGAVAHLALFRPLQARLGLANTRRVYSSGPVPDADSCKVLASIGLDLRQLELSDGRITSSAVPTPTIQPT